MADSTDVDLQRDGVLWLVNRVVFHPRGFALGVDLDTGGLTLLGDGTDPWTFLPETDEDEKFTAVEALFERARRGNPHTTDPEVAP